MTSLPAVSDRFALRSARYLPRVIVATSVVALLPVAVVWWLRGRGMVSSPWVCVPLTVVLSFALASVGKAYWKRRRGSGDVMFSELLVWGWLHRLIAERRVANATELLDVRCSAVRGGVYEASVERRAQVLRQLAIALEAHDPYTEGHSRRVARHAARIAHRMGLSDEEAATVRAAAVVHDVGKLHVPIAVLSKPDRLTAAEFELVKRHAEDGAEMVACLEDDELTAIVRHHHERIDGTGYPAGLVRGQIPLGARIVAVADTFDAITAARPYRPSASHERAFQTLAEESGTHLDPVVVRAFVDCYAGRRGLVLWAALTASLQSALAWPGAGAVIRPRLTPRGILANSLLSVAVAVAAIAAPIGLSSRHERQAASPAPAGALAATSATDRLARSASARTPSRRAARIVGRRRVAADRHAVSHGSSTASGLRARSVARGAPNQAPPTSPATTPPGALPPSTPTAPPMRAPSSPTTTTGNPTRTTTAGTSTGRPSPPPVMTPIGPTATAGPPTVTTTTSNPPSTSTTPPPSSSSALPVSKDQCKGGGYGGYGFENQGQCIASVLHRG